MDRGFVQGRNIGDGVLGPQKFDKNRNRRWTYEPFDGPLSFTTSLGNAPAVGTTGAINQMISARGNYFEQHIKGAGQTIIVPIWDRVNGMGLDIAHDLVATEGVEYSGSPNITTAGFTRGKHSYMIGTDKAFYAKWKVYLTDASGLNPLFVGWVKHQAYDTAIGNYTDFAGFNLTVNGTVADIKIQTNLNNGGAALVDTTQDAADLAARTFEVLVKQDGTAIFRLDNAFPTVTKTNFVFDAGDVVRPTLFMLHGTDAAELTFWQEFECGFVPTRGQ